MNTSSLPPSGSEKTAKADMRSTLAAYCPVPSMSCDAPRAALSRGGHRQMAIDRNDAPHPEHDLRQLVESSLPTQGP